MSTKARGTLLTVGFLALIVLFSTFDVVSELTEALIMAGAGMASVALCEWRG